MNVFNVVKPTVGPSSSTDWLTLWEKFSNKKATVCAELYCLSCKKLAGGFVQKKESDREYFIVPLCDEHNKSIKTLKLKENAILVPCPPEESFKNQ